MAYMPTMLQQVYNYPVDLAGYITAPRGIAAVISALVTQAIIIKKLGNRRTISLGIIIFGISCFLFTNISSSINEQLIITVSTLQGIGMMMFFVPFMGILVVGIKEEDMADMTGSFNFFRNFGMSVGTAFIATFISRSQQTNYQDLAQNIIPFNQNFQMWSSIMHAPDNITIALAHSQILKQSSIISYVSSYYVIGVLCMILAIVPFILKEPTQSTTAVAMH